MNGFNLEKEKLAQDGTEWKFAGALKCLAEIPENERTFYLPLGEVQRTMYGDLADCASRGPINIAEAKFNYLIKKQLLTLDDELWLRENGYFDDGIKFSDAFVAILSGTTREGNSMKAPLDAIRKNGLIPKKFLPIEQDMTFEDYHDPARITGKMKALGQEFLNRFAINYEKVYENDFERLLHKDLLNVAGYAWPTPVGGEYPRVPNDPNHVFVAYKTPKYFIFDNYLDSVDGDFTKKLSPEYDLMDYGYRLLINKAIKKECFIIKYLKVLWS